MMEDFPSFEISGLWQGRSEPPKKIAGRLHRYLTLSRPAFPVEMRRYGCDHPDLFDVDEQPQRIAPFVSRRVCKDEEGGIYLPGGYFTTCLFAHGAPAIDGKIPFMDLRAGSLSQNHFHFFTCGPLATASDPRLVTYDAMRTNVMSAVWAFEPDWCSAGPIALQNYLDTEVYNRPAMSLAWMIWLKPSLAAQIEPPHRSEHTIVERYADGSLFMATSKETFDCGRPSHLRSARAIHRQIDPLNYTETFCGMSGRSDRVPPFPKL